MDLTGKVAIVTGCSSGVGLATAQLFLSLGAKVFGLDRSTCNLDSTNFIFCLCDLGYPSDIKDAVKKCIQISGSRIDILANVAGVMDGFASSDSVTNDSWTQTLNINLNGPSLLIQEVLPFMTKHRNGSIINVGSKASTSGGVAGVAYTASKHAMIGVTKNVAWRFHNEGIRCNAVCPGSMATNIQQSMKPESFDQAAYSVSSGFIALHMTPEGKPPIEPAHAANVIAFLASDLANGVTGAVIPVDLGWSCL